MTLSLVLDVIIIGIILLCIFLSARHGFVRTVIEVAGFIAAFVIAFTISSPLANVTYDNIIEPSIVSTVEKASDNSGNEIATRLWDSFPDFVKRHSADFGLSEERFNEKVNSSVSGSINQSALKVSENVTKPLITKLLGALYSTVIVIVLIIVSKFLAKALNKLFSFSLVGTLNKMLGGVIGAVKGVGVAIIFCMVISALILITKNGFWIFTPDNIDGSYLFKLFYGFSPFV